MAKGVHEWRDAAQRPHVSSIVMVFHFPSGLSYSCMALVRQAGVHVSQFLPVLDQHQEEKNTPSELTTKEKRCKDKPSICICHIR